MATDSVTVRFRAQYAAGGDYQTLPLACDYGSGKDWVSSVPVRQKQIREAIGLGGTTFSMADFTSIQTLIVYNEDASNYVTVGWTSGGNANSQRVPAGAPLIIPQADVASIALTANTAACVCTLIVFGA